MHSIGIFVVSVIVFLGDEYEALPSFIDSSARLVSVNYVPFTEFCVH